MTNFKELFRDSLPIISSYAPTISRLFGGPFGTIAAYIIPILADYFNSPSGDLKELAANILNDPDASKKLAKIEATHGDWLNVAMDSVNNLSKLEINIKLEWQPEVK